MAAALVVAAGSGERLGAGEPKALVVCGGKSLLQWSLEALQAVPEITQVVVALPADISADILPSSVVGVPGGAERSQSVRAALAAVDDEHEVVIVHDAARPMITPGDINRVLRAVTGSVDGATAATPVTDTIKVAEPDGVTVDRTLDRGSLWSIQTPQVFRRGALERALEQPDAVLAAATDDASLVEAAGGRLVVVPTSPQNIKVTTPQDLQLAELLLAGR